MKERILKTDKIGKKFPGVIALENVSIELYPGEVLAILGENGAGKSTLVKILSGVYPEYEGTVYLEDKPVKFKRSKDAQDMGINIIHQELNLCKDLTVFENITLGNEKKYFGNLVDKKAEIKLVQEILDGLEVNIDPLSKVGELTVGEQQMVEIAKAIPNMSKVLILDEPTSALTEKEVLALFKTIKKLKKEGVGIIYISHRLAEFEHIVDRVTVLRDGKYIDTKIFTETTIDELISLMVGRELKELYPSKDFQPSEKIVLSVEKLSHQKFFKDVSFKLHQGEILGFAGLMGAGRTELAKTIIGHYKSSGGSIKVHDKLTKSESVASMMSKGLGYLTENRRDEGLILQKDISFNIGLNCIERFSNKFKFVNTKALDAVTTKRVKELSIKTPNNEQEVRLLSGGNQQKVIIGRWLTQEADILIFDEPTRGIDVNSKYEIYELIYALAKTGASIVLISSELPELVGLCDRVVVMSDGKLTGILSGEEISQERIMQYATL